MRGLVVAALFASLPAFLACLVWERACGEPTVIDIGDRLEPFVDGYLIQAFDGVSLHLTAPTRREVVLTLDKPWEGPNSAYFTVFRDGGRIRMYYRGYCPGDLEEQQVTCYAESADGVHFRRPVLGLFEFHGSRENNIVFRGKAAHNLAPFRDDNPQAKPAERYKAVAGLEGRLYAFASADGIRWRKLRDEPVLTDGAFDSLNVAFWDPNAGLYRCYSRAWTGGGYQGYRAIQSCTSRDFIHWSQPRLNLYTEGTPAEHFYTNATVLHPDAEHILLSFPMRFVPERTKLRDYSTPGVSDAMFMSSRDGVHWDRTFLGAWLRPGPDVRNWTHRSTMPAWGIVVTGDEFSLYVSEHYDWPDNRLRRVTVPRNRLASLHAGPSGGTVTTKPLRFEGQNLVLNYSTSATGSISCELLTPSGSLVSGFGAQDCDLAYGDEFDAIMRWRGRSLAEAGINPVVLRFRLRDADIYALRVTDGP